LALASLITKSPEQNPTWQLPHTKKSYFRKLRTIGLAGEELIIASADKIHLIK